MNILNEKDIESNTYTYHANQKHFNIDEYIQNTQVADNILLALNVVVLKIDNSPTLEEGIQPTIYKPPIL